MKTGIVLFNLGGPLALEDVKPFLYRLFSDPDILVGVPAPLRQLLALVISQVKGSSSIEMYRKIGGGSPQLKWTELQARGLNGLLGEGTARVAIGMRAWKPEIGDALRELREWGAEEVVFFPLFPQYSTTTTGSCFKEARRQLARLGWSPRVREVRNWPDHPGYVALLRRTVDEAVSRAEAERGSAPETIHVLFSAHSLPMKVIERGDPYPDDVGRTLAAAARGLKHPFSLAYQSRNGKLPWLQPYTEFEIERLARAGLKRLVVVPLSFVSDHIETLFELDQLYAELARKHGIEHYYRARSFNDDPEFPRVLASVLSGARA